MLGYRLLTALVLIPLVVLAVFRLSNPAFALASTLVPLAGIWELTTLAGLEGKGWRLAVVAAGALLLMVLWRFGATVWADGLLLALGGWWLVNLIVLLSGRVEPRSFTGLRVVRLLLGLLFLSGAWLALVRLHQLPNGPVLVLFVLALVWVADSAAYFAGRALGRHKLAPHISPGKTMEGAGGALAGAALFSLLGHYMGWLPLNAFSALLLGVATAAVSVGGDLWESLLKRERGVKDSGSLLPGHGGVLDRVDSQIAALPFFLAGLMILGVG